MENASYALYIAVGVLIGILMLSLLIFRWKQLGSVENAKDSATVIKNRAEFNAEYEVYNKRLMYGTDVLSCLNKAQNNNQKYVYSNYYGTSVGKKEDREEFFIDVQVTIKSTLSDSFKAYTIDSSGKYTRVIGLKNTDEPNYSDLIFSKTDLNHFDSPNIIFYYFEKGNVYSENINYIDIMWTEDKKNKKLYYYLNPGKIETKFKNGTYHLLTKEDTSSVTSKDQTAKLAALISTVSLKKQILNNKNTVKSYWDYCTWTTAASDFKTRKFKCTGVEYDQNNGYIEKISFEEISN